MHKQRTNPSGRRVVPAHHDDWFAGFYVFHDDKTSTKTPKEHAELVNSLGKGDEVLMSSGLMGKIVDLSDLYIVVNVSDKVDLKFQRTHVTATLPKGTIKTLGT